MLRSKHRLQFIKFVVITIIAALALCMFSCKESESHKAKRLGLEYGNESFEPIHKQEEAFSFEDALYDKDSSIGTTEATTSPLIIADALPSGPLAKVGSYSVVDVYDGDTITISDGYGNIKVRLLGYDTPEMRDAEPFNRAWAINARDYLRSLIVGESVRLRLDKYNVQRDHLDRYGRTLAYVYRESDRLYVNAQMMRMGLSKEYEKFAFEDLRYFRQLAAKAREEKRGLWAN